MARARRLAARPAAPLAVLSVFKTGDRGLRRRHRVEPRPPPAEFEALESLAQDSFTWLREEQGQGLLFGTVIRVSGFVHPVAPAPP